METTLDYASGICPHCLEGEVQVPIDDWEIDPMDPQQLLPVFGTLAGECSNGCAVHPDDIDDVEIIDYVLYKGI